MQPLAEFRQWTRDAPVAERARTAVVVGVAVVVLAWALSPSFDGDQDAATATASFDEVAGGDVATKAPGTEPGASGGPGTGAGTAAPGQPVGATGPVAGTGGSAQGTDPAVAGGGAEAAPTPASGGGCTSLPGEAEGVDAESVTIAVGLTEIAGAAANSLFNLPSPAEQQQGFEAVIAGINAEGGVACRQLRARYHRANPADESQMLRVCLEVAESDVFAMVDTGALGSRPNVVGCFGQNRIPYFGGFATTEAQRQQYFPYVYGFYTKELLYQTSAIALRARGFLDPARGFDKLGFLYKSCEKDAIGRFRTWLVEAGVAPSDIVPYDLGCPPAFAAPSDLAQAVLTFRRQGVTHVVTGNIPGDLANFTNIAEQQGFRPRYAFPDESVISLSEGNQRPNPDNIDGAVAITLSRQGERDTPGIQPNPGTARCDAYYAAAGQGPVHERHALAGNTCNQLWMVQAALGRAPSLEAAALPEGLQRTGSIDFSFPQGPNDFTAPGTTTGGQFSRVARFDRGCECWLLDQTDFTPGPSVR